MILKKQITFLKELLKRNWNDPVWSKVISAGILATLGLFGTFLYAFFRSLYLHVSFKSIFHEINNYFLSSTKVNNIILWVFILISIIITYSFFKNLKKKIQLGNKADKNSTQKLEKPLARMSSTAFFSHRLSEAFPGQRDLQWYEPKEAVNRFKIFFKNPISFKPDQGSYDISSDPVWWFRAGSALNITNFKVISKTKVIIENQELELKKVAVYVSRFYKKSFIYLEAKAEEPVGIYKYPENHFKKFSEDYGYYTEEYGLLGKKIMTRQEYDDKAMFVNGIRIDASNAELRERCLTDYNMIIAAKNSPFNSNKFDRESGSYFNDILKGQNTIENFIEYLKVFETETN
ncbi:MAG: hypothetical protein V4622_13680 [Bacteroidota bacterium]